MASFLCMSTDLLLLRHACISLKYSYFRNKNHRACIQNLMASLTITCMMCTSTRIFPFLQWRKTILPGGVDSRYVPFCSWPPSLSFCVPMAQAFHFTPSSSSPTQFLMAENFTIIYYYHLNLKKQLSSFMLKFGYCIINVPTLSFLKKITISPHTVLQFLQR